jgi:hypothetical protein
VVQAPEHVIENLQLDQKKAAGGRKFVKRKPPERNFVNWDRQTFLRLVAAPPERLSSQFQVTHGMLLNVLSRPEDGCRAMQNLIARSHEPARARKEHTRRAWQLFRALVERRIVEFIPRTAAGAKVRVHVDLQEDFSMNQTLSLYVHDTLALMDPGAPDYALVVLTLVESILEDPEVILRRQLERVKSQAIAEMKEEGLDYNARMEELEKLEYPKPNREFVYSTFNAFVERHPWVGEENIRPKSVAREMFEEFRSFDDYIMDYDLQRAEGVLLRHLSSVQKVLVQTVPEFAKTDDIREIELYLRAMIRRVDSSLLDEWEKMRNPDWRPRDLPGEADVSGNAEGPRDVTRDPKAFVIAVRNRIFPFLRSLSGGDFEGALEEVPSSGQAEGGPWTPARLLQIMEAYRALHGRFRLDPEARNLRHTHVIPSDDRLSWRVEQMLIDPGGANDWAVEFEVDIAESRLRGEPVVRLVRIGNVG